jgi:hypothetical protein
MQTQIKNPSSRSGINISYGLLIFVIIGAILGFFNVQHQGFYMWLSASIPFGVAAGVVKTTWDNRRAKKADPASKSSN